MEYKSGDLTVKQVSEGKVVATLARLGVRDRDGDLLKTGLVSTGQLVAIKPQHKWDHVDLGVANVYETQEGTLEAAMEFNMAIPSARDWWEAVRFSHEKKRRQQYSFGFEVMDFSHETHEGRPIRVLKQIEMAEVSPVLIGASIGSETLMVKELSSPTRRFWPGGITPMKGTKEHVSAAVTSLWSGMRQLHHVRRELARSPAAVKSDPAFETAFEHLDAALDSLNEALLVPADVPVVATLPTAPPPKAADGTPSIPKTVDADSSDAAADSGVPEPEEKGGLSKRPPIQQEMEDLIRLLEERTDRLEDIKQARASVSDRYPHGRPMSPERLAQVDRVMARLSRLKETSAEVERTDEAQRDLREMAERLKGFGVAV